MQEYNALKAEIEGLENELSAGQGIDRKLQKAPSEPGFSGFRYPMRRLGCAAVALESHSGSLSSSCA